MQGTSIQQQQGLEKTRPGGGMGEGRHVRVACLALAGLLVVPCLALVWPGPVLPALPWPGPATTTGRLRRPAAAAPPLLLLLLLDQAKPRQARQAQARPSQGKAQKASQPSQGKQAPHGKRRHMGPLGPFGAGLVWQQAPHGPWGPVGPIWAPLGLIDHVSHEGTVVCVGLLWVVVR